MSEVANVVASIAVAKYRKFGLPTQLIADFKKAVKTLNITLVPVAETENHVRMEFDFSILVEEPTTKNDLLELAKFAGVDVPKTMLESIESAVPTKVFSIQMTSHYAENSYELDARCEPFLVEKAHRQVLSKEEASRTNLDLAFEEACRFLDAVFVGGMNCDTILRPRPLNSWKTTHSLLVNISKTRTQLTDSLIESLIASKKEVLVTGWIGSYIIPHLKRCHDRGVEVKIVTHKPELAEGSRGAKDKAMAFAELSRFLSPDLIRILGSCHARMVLVDEVVAFVGSMDLDSEALAERDEMAVMSNDPTVIGNARTAFQELFSRGQRPQWPQKT